LTPKIYYGPRLLESYCCNQKIIRGCQSLGRCCKKVADQASTLADPRPKFCAHTQLDAAGRPSFSLARQTASQMQFSDTIVDQASCYKEPKALSPKNSDEVRTSEVVSTAAG